MSHSKLVFRFYTASMKGKDKNMNTKDRFVEVVDKTMTSIDELLQIMQENIIKETVLDELFKWEGLLMHLENQHLLKKDDDDIEITAAAFAYAIDNPCQEENDQEIVEAVYAIRDKIVTKAKEIGLGSRITPKSLILALNNSKERQLADYIHALQVNL